MQLGYSITVALAQAGSYSSDWTPSLETSIHHRCSPKKTKRQKKKKKKRERERERDKKVTEIIKLGFSDYQLRAKVYSPLKWSLVPDLLL